MVYKLKGAGLPNVYLIGGVIFEGKGDEQAVSYLELDGLYKSIDRAVALRSGILTHGELKFLRKRLGMNQAEVAALGDKSVQAAAKWEKGTSPVPKAEGDLLRLKALTVFGNHKDILQVANQLGSSAHPGDLPYVFRFDGSDWAYDQDAVLKVEENMSFKAALSAHSAIESAKLTSSEVAYTTAPNSNITPQIFSGSLI